MAIIHTDWRPSTDFIKIYDGNLTEEFCELCIERFEADSRKQQGVTGRGVLIDVKDSLDLWISSLSEWEEIDTILHSSLSGPVQDMFEMLDQYTQRVVEPTDTGYQIQKTTPEGGYVWHNDSCVYEDTRERLFTYLWYLNTVTEGGETEFLDRKIQPVAGRLILFPSTWTYFHRGLPPKTGSKYVCTGWMLSDPLPPKLRVEP